MSLLSVTSAVTPGGAEPPADEERKRDNDPPTIYKDVRMNNDPPTDQNADSNGNRNAADAVAMISRSESKKRGHNRPTVSSNTGEKNVGNLGVYSGDAVMLSSVSKPNENNKTDGSTVDATNSKKDGDTVDASTSKIDGGMVDASTGSVDRITESLLGASAEEKLRSRPSFKTLTWQHPDVRFEVFAFIGGARCEWLAYVCQIIVEWLLTQLWTHMAMSFVVCSRTKTTTRRWIERGKQLPSLLVLYANDAYTCCKTTTRRWIEHGKQLPSLLVLYANVAYACCAMHRVKSIVIDMVDGVVHSNGNVFYDILVYPLSTLLSGSSRLPSSDGRANHRTHTPMRLEQQQLDRFHYETTAEDNKTPSRFQEWTATRMESKIAQQEPRSGRLVMALFVMIYNHRHNAGVNGLAITLAAMIYYHHRNAGVKAMQILMTRINILPSVLAKRGKGRECPEYCLEREREGNGRERPKYCRGSMLLRKWPQDWKSTIQECPSYIAARPQECNSTIQECPSYNVATSDSLSSSHERNDSNAIKDARNLHSYVFMGRCSADDQLPSDSDNEYSDSEYSDGEYSDSEYPDNEYSDNEYSEYSDNEYSENDSETVVPQNYNSVKFVGACKSNLKGAVLVYSPDTAIMLKQLQVFLPRVEDAAGMISGEMGKSIKQQKAISLVDLVAKLQTIPKSSYTIKDADGKETVDIDLKARMDRIQDRVIQRIADNYSKFVSDWKRFYATILGQLCPATKEELRRSDGWETVADKMDPGALLCLIQSTCLYGNDKDYYPERALAAMQGITTIQQGNSTPSEFAELMKTGMKIFEQLLKIPPGETFYGQFLGMREYAVSVSDKFNFDIKDYDSQSTAVKHLVHQKCEDLMIGCTMTVRSNRSKSDTHLEARKNQLAGNPGGYATDAASAVNILVGNEMLKRNGSEPQRSATNDSDDGDRDYTDSDYSDNSDGDGDADVEYTDDEESYGTAEYTDGEESYGTIEDTDDEISIGTSGVEEPIENPGVNTEEGPRRSSRHRRAPERFEETTSYFEARAKYNDRRAPERCQDYDATTSYFEAREKYITGIKEESVTSKTNDDG